MAIFPTIKEMSEEVAERVFDEYIYKGKTLREWIEALVQSEEALEAEPCEDAISREEMLKYQWYLHGKMPNEENHKLWQFINSLPSVAPKQKTGEWIELKDQKPEEFENVLVKDIDGDVTCAYLCDDGDFLERFSGEIIDDVVEWREIS